MKHPPVLRRVFNSGSLLLALSLAFSLARAAEPVPFPAVGPDPDHTPPKLLQRVEPDYPAGVAETNDRRVYVAFHVDASGRVRNASAMFTPPPAFAIAAVAAVEQWVFEPGRIRNERPVWTQMTVELWFKPANAVPGGPDPVVAAVLAANTALTDAANRLDTDAFFAGVVDSDETRIIQDGKLFKTRAEAMAAVRSGAQGIAKLERRFEDPHVVLHGTDAALLTAEGVTAATLTDGRTITQPFAVSLVFVLRQGRWLLFHGHYSIPNPRQ